MKRSARHNYSAIMSVFLLVLWLALRVRVSTLAGVELWQPEHLRVGIFTISYIGMWPITAQAKSSAG